jgi:hypothetical protein
VVMLADTLTRLLRHINWLTCYPIATLAL